MKYFNRSLKYLLPYKKRLSVALVCVVFIAGLWGAGLGMLLPAINVLISPEGLHGLVWSKIIKSRAEASVVFRLGNDKTTVEGKTFVMYLDIVSMKDDSPAKAAGLKEGDTLVGILDGNPQHRLMGGNAVASYIAEYKSDEPLKLNVFNPYEDTLRPVALQLKKQNIASTALSLVISKIKEPANMSERFPLFVWVLGIAIVLTILRDALRFVQEYLVQTAVWQGTMDLRCENYNVALKLPTTFYAQQGTSDTMSRFIQDTGEIARGMVTLFGKTLVEPAKAIGALLLALWVSWEFTLFVLVAGPPAAILIHWLGKKMKKASRRALEGWSSMLAVLEETLTGIRVVKAYTMEAAERKRFFRVNRKLLKQQFKIARIDSAIAPSIEMMGIIAGMIAAGLAGYQVLNGKMPPGEFVTWLAALFAMFDSVRKLSKVITRFQQSDSAAKRIFELQDQPQEKRVLNAPMLPAHSRDIEFKNVMFRYPATKEDTLRGINLTVNFGQTIAIVGPNGSGKTTLVSLLPRLLDPTGGKILIDGCDIMTHSLRSLRRQIAVVTQDSVLFNATIAENISYGLRRPTKEEILSAAKQSYVDDFVNEMPNGYDTMVGEHGATLSGGQKQRITIARAILRDPKILIFDEALSQIDPESEQKIHKAMQEFMKRRTTFMIAHRFSTVISADRILVINDGLIEDSGTHDELLSRCKLYEQLYRTQFVNDE